MFPSASSSVVMNQSGIAGVEPSVGLRICLHIVRSVIDDLAGAEPTSIIPKWRVHMLPRDGRQHQTASISTIRCFMLMAFHGLHFHDCGFSRRYGHRPRVTVELHRQGFLLCRVPT